MESYSKYSTNIRSNRLIANIYMKSRNNGSFDKRDENKLIYLFFLSVFLKIIF